MRTKTARWLLAPISSWRARRLQAEHPGLMTSADAWLTVRARDHPDELPYLLDALARRNTTRSTE